MDRLSQIGARLRSLLRPDAVERDIDDELRGHLDRERDRFLRDGLSAADADAAARRAFGGFHQAREACRDARSLRMITDLRQDLRYAARVLRAHPGLTFVIVATLAVAIAGNTTLFSIVNGVLLRPLPYPEPDRLVSLTEQTRSRPDLPVSYPDYQDWLARQKTFDSLAASLVIGGVLSGPATAERVFGRAVSHNFLSTLGVSPVLGRVFTPDEDRPGGPRVMIISYALWQRRYGGDRGVLGHAAVYNDDAYTIVGVLPADFDYYGRDNPNNDFFLPLQRFAGEHWMLDRDTHPFAVVGRLARGVPIAQASADLSTIARSLAAEHPATNADVGVNIRSLLDDYIGDVRLALGVLLGAAGLVLAIACANVANLLLARATTRRREMAMRLALGAGPGRVLRQVLAESAALSLLGGAAGVLFGMWGTRLLVRVAPRSLPRVTEISIDWHVLLFALGLTLLTGLLFGAAPALLAARVDIQQALHDGGRAVGSRGGRWVREAVVMAEIAICAALLVGAGLLLRSVDELAHVDPGYVPQQLVTLRLRLSDGRYRDRPQALGFLRRTLADISALPGVESACLATGVPLGRANMERFVIAGAPPGPDTQLPVALMQWVTPAYHRTLGIRLLAGRVFSDSDNELAENVALVDEDFGHRYFPDAPLSAVLGKRVRVTGEGMLWRRVVGVVRHVRHASLDEQPHVEMYAPFEQMEPQWQLEMSRAMDVAVRTSADAAAQVADIRRVIEAIDPQVPISHVHTMTDLLETSLAPRTFDVGVLAAFAATALLLCLLGIYGVMSYTVNQRTRELVVRIALGADRADVTRVVLARGLRLMAGGLAGGLVAAVAVGRVLQALLYGITPHDAATFATAAALITIVGAAASWVPLRRAIAIDPVIALKSE